MPTPLRLRLALAWLLLSLLAPPPASAASRAEALASSMSLEEKVGQVFMVWFEGPTVSADLSRLIRDRHLGGVILYSLPGNIHSPGQVATLTAGIQATAAETGKGLGLLVGVDQEGGPVARLRQGVTLFPSQMAQAAVGRSDLVRQAATITGQELRALGINVDFAPVADVNVNPANPVIGIRSFGSDPATVARLTAAATDGYGTAGIICTPKHFPGHGDTNVDSHVGLPEVTHDAATLARVDFPPFRAAFAAKAPAVMTAHVLAPALDPDRVPATLSSRVLVGTLRGRLGFGGAIFTDSLGMGAVATRLGTAEAAVQALAAGADVLLVGADAGRPPAERDEAMDAVLAAVRQGRIPATRLAEAVTRVLRLKERFGLLSASILAKPTPGLDRLVGTSAHLELARRIAARSLTAVSLDKGRLPLPASSATLVVRPRLDREVTDTEAEAAIAGWSGVQTAFVASDPDETAIAGLVERAQNAQVVVLLATDALRREGQRRLAKALGTAMPGKLVLVAAESPYDLPVLPETPVRLAMYGETPVGLQALREGLFTRFRFTGRCPASLNTVEKVQ
jgi:beta-N-acetylhexosaminidase